MFSFEQHPELCVLPQICLRWRAVVIRYVRLRVGFCFAMIGVLLILWPTNASFCQFNPSTRCVRKPCRLFLWNGWAMSMALGCGHSVIHLFHPIWPALTLILHIASVACMCMAGLSFMEKFIPAKT